MLRTLPAAFFVLLFSACDGAGPTDALTCALSTGTSAAAAIPVSVTYRATKTGDGVLTRLTYRTDDGEQTVTSPALPWTLTVTIGAGRQAGLSGAGSVRDGSLQIEYTGQAQQSGTTVNLSGRDDCAQTRND